MPSFNGCDYLRSRGIKAEGVTVVEGETTIHFSKSVNEVIHHDKYMSHERVMQIYADQSTPMPGNAKWVIRISQGVTMLELR